MKISVIVKPGAKVDAVFSEGKNLTVKTKEPAQEGKANLAAMRLLAEYFKVPRTAIRIISGKNSRNKLIEVLDK